MRKGINHEASKRELSVGCADSCVMDTWNSTVAWVGLVIGLLLSSVGMDSGG